MTHTTQTVTLTLEQLAAIRREAQRRNGKPTMPRHVAQALVTVSRLFGGQTFQMPYLDPLSERGKHKAMLAARAPVDPRYKLTEEFIQGLNPLLWQAANAASMNHPDHQSQPAHQRDALMHFLQRQTDRQLAIVRLLQAQSTHTTPPAAQSSHQHTAYPTPAHQPDAPAPAPVPPASTPV